MIVLDTTVFVYAVGVAHRLRRACRDILEAIEAERLSATTTVEVLQEFAHVRSQRRPRGDAVRQATNLAISLSPLLRPDEADLLRGLELYARHPRIGAFDAVLAATVMNRPHLTALVSADRGFATVSGLVHLEPSDPAVLA